MIILDIDGTISSRVYNSSRVVVRSCCDSSTNRVSGAHQSLTQSNTGSHYTTTVVVVVSRIARTSTCRPPPLSLCYLLVCAVASPSHADPIKHLFFTNHHSSGVPSGVSLFFCLLARPTTTRRDRHEHHYILPHCCCAIQVALVADDPGGATHKHTGVLLAREWSHVWAKRAIWTRLARCWIS